MSTNSTATKSRSSAPSRSSASSRSTPAPSRNNQASQARQSTTSRPSTTTTPKTTTTQSPSTTRPSDGPSALNRLQSGKSEANAKSTNLQTGQDGYAHFEDKTEGGAAVKDHADRVANGFADAFGEPQANQAKSQTQATEAQAKQGQETQGNQSQSNQTQANQQKTDPRQADQAQANSGGCPNGDCSGGQQGGEAGGGEGGGGGGGGFMDKLLQLAQVGGDIAKTAIEASQGAAQKGAEAAQQGLEAAGQGVDQAKDMLKNAQTRFDLNDEQKKQLETTMDIFKKLAGDDGRWNEKDLANNIAQLSGLKGPLGERMRKGLEEATGKKIPPPTDEQQAAAQKWWDGLTPEQQQDKQIGMFGLRKFGQGMDMIKDRAQELGLPESKFPNGMSVNFLQSIYNNDPGWRMMLNR